MIRSKVIAAAVCIAVCTFCAAKSLAAATSSNRLPANFIVQSHRGAGELAPENTIEAFELGWAMGTIPEADFRTTKDGVIVAFHDSNFKRTVRNVPPELAGKGVSDITFAELQKLDVGAWKGDQFAGRRVSRVLDVFKLMSGKPDRRLYMDIKKVDFKQLASEVESQHVERQVILSTPSHEQVKEWKALLPTSQTLLWMGGGEKEIEQRFEKLRADGFEGITQIQIHVRLNTNGVSSEPFNLSQSFIRKLGAELRSHNILLQSLPWGATDPEVYWKLMDLGVASFATDHPDKTVKAVNDYFSAREKKAAGRTEQK